jgi:N utilization substance protein B
MGTRRLSREQALQALFYMDMHRDPVEDPVGSSASAFHQGQPRSTVFHRLVRGAGKPCKRSIR